MLSAGGGETRGVGGQGAVIAASAHDERIPYRELPPAADLYVHHNASENPGVLERLSGTFRTLGALFSPHTFIDGYEFFRAARYYSGYQMVESVGGARLLYRQGGPNTMFVIGSPHDAWSFIRMIIDEVRRRQGIITSVRQFGENVIEAQWGSGSLAIRRSENAATKMSELIVGVESSGEGANGFDPSLYLQGLIQKFHARWEHEVEEYVPLPHSLHGMAASLERAILNLRGSERRRAAGMMSPLNYSETEIDGIGRMTAGIRQRAGVLSGFAFRFIDGERLMPVDGELFRVTRELTVVGRPDRNG